MLFLIINVAAVSVALYVAWINGMFLRCPHCGKGGSWRFKATGPSKDRKDEDGVVQESSQVLICPKCEGRILSKWSDHGGRRFQKL
jgi:DNA-directed RNA polymerase subunit RPC12/RpoP